MTAIDNEFIKCYDILYEILYGLEEIRLMLENNKNQPYTVFPPFDPLKTIGKYW
jgi:hypothetical protein